MALIFRCPHCDERHKVHFSKAGKSGPCKRCGKTIKVPVPQAGIEDPESDMEVSPSGSPIWRYQPRKVPFEFAVGDADNIELISNHIEAHLGEVETVLHEIISDLVHIDVHVVGPTDEVPYYRLVTSGMSEAPMTVPDGLEQLRFAELMVTLPGDWPLTQEAFKDEANYWPVRWLKMVARLPHEYDTWVGYGHTIPNGDPPEPYAENTRLCCVLLLPSPTAPRDFLELEVSESKTIHFYSIVPLYAEEVEFKLRRGVEPLMEQFDKYNIGDLIDVKRRNVCKRGWFS